jgi:hypothetical protein
VPARPSGKTRLRSKVKLLESENVRWWEVDRWVMQQRGETEHLVWSFVLCGQHYDEIVIALWGLHFGENFEVNFGQGCMRNILRNANFGYQYWKTKVYLRW